MKRILFLIVSLFAVVGVAVFAKSLPHRFTSTHQDWQFIESVGGMAVKLEGERLLVRCDVSGTQTITKKPRLLNSAMAVRKLRCRREGNLIRLSVVTSVIGKGMSTECGEVDVSPFPPGTYEVVYVDPDGAEHPVGEVTRS